MPGQGPLPLHDVRGDLYNKSMRFATKLMKQAVIALSMLYLSYSFVGEIEGYSRRAWSGALSATRRTRQTCTTSP